MAESIIAIKSLAFAVKIVNLYKHLCDDKHEYVLSKQLLRSGTSIGANVSEGKYGQTMPDFITKLSIALKEASETEYWLKLLFATDYITETEYSSLNADSEEILKMLTAALKTAKKKYSE